MKNRLLQLFLDSRIKIVKFIINPPTEIILEISELEHCRLIWTFLFYRYLRIILQNAIYVDCQIYITAWIDQLDLVMDLRNVCQACSSLGFVLNSESLAFKTRLRQILPFDC